jgi:hypothetical protein
MYTEKELSSLIEDVTKEFTSHLAKAEQSLGLSKNEDEQPKDKKINGMADDKKNSAKDEKTSASENKEGGKSDDNRNASADQKQEGNDAKKEASADKSGKPMEGESHADKGIKDQHQQQAGANPAQGEDHGYDDEDMAHMHSMYSSMPRSELKAHHDCIRKCMDGMAMSMSENEMAKAEMEDSKEGEYRPNGGPHDGEATSKKTAPASGTQALEKSEKFLEVDTTSVKEVQILKSELQAAKAEAEATKKNLDAVETFLKEFVKKAAPAGKAITSLDVIAKTESMTKEKPLSKSEIDSKLLAKAKDQSLSKSDRDAINSYYFTKNIEKVSHLLK